MIKLSWIPALCRNGKGYDRVWHKLGCHLYGTDRVVSSGFFDTKPDLRVPIGVPKAWYLPPGDEVCSDLVYHTMWETDTIPDDWLPILNRSRALWVPSQWVKKNFEACGVTRPIHVSGYGIDPKEFPTRERKADQPFTFMAMGRYLGGRKGVLDVIRAFVQLDLPDARLFVKVSDIPFSRIADQPNIEMANLHIGIKELAYRMAKADCFVYPSKGEGFGLEPLEAMCAGTCVIATNFSGMTEYLNENTAMLLPIMGYKAPVGPAYEGIGKWGEIGQRALKAAMLQAYSDRGRCWKMGARAAEYVRDCWRWGQAAERGADVLEEILEGQNYE